MNNCLDTGTIQAFLDGELAPAAAAGVSAHIAACDACASQLASAEEESAFVFSVLEREMDALVPTHRLWSKINDSIDVQRKTAPAWKKAWSIFTASLMNPSLAIAAGILVVLGLFSVIFVEMNKRSGAGDDIATTTPQTTRIAPVDITGDKASLNKPASDQNDSQTPAKSTKLEGPRAINAVYHPAPVPDRRPAVEVTGQPAQAAYIPGEESYVKTIASLSQTIDNQKDTVLKPSERISYERDMAVVDDAIKKMRTEVRRNPKNESAKQVLYTSYQNKIDLLNSVSQREELMASLSR